MGLQATCEARFWGVVSQGKARLEEREIVFRGDFRLRIPLAEMEQVEARAGRLEVSFGGRKAIFALGPAAEKWALKIRQPRSLVDKLGVKRGSVISVIGPAEAGLIRDLRSHAESVSVGRPHKGSDLVFLSVGRKADLGRLSKARRSLKTSGALWVVWPKGRKELTENDIRALALRSGLVDVKVVRVSETLSGLKLVIPVDRR